MPIIAFSIVKLLALPNEIALGLILVGCTPGGTTSNLWTYLSRGNVALSIVMTVSSTILAIFLMPILIFIFASSIISNNLQIPYINIVITLLLILIPVTIGIIIRNNNKEIAQKIEKIGTTIGLIVIIIAFLSAIVQNKEMLLTTSWKIYLSVIIFPYFGFLFGYIVSKLSGLDKVSQRTVSLETGIQNTPLTIAIIMLSFQEPVLSKVLIIPAFYALWLGLVSPSVTFFIFRPMSKNEPT